MILGSDHAALLERLIPCALSRLHPSLSAVITPDQLRAGLTADIQRVLTRASSRAWAEQWKAACPALPATIDDLLAREVRVGEGTALLELRFRGLDPSFPFVEVVGTEAPIDADTLPLLCAAARRCWPEVPLRCLGLWLAPHTTWRPPGEGDMLLVAGAREMISSEPGPLTVTLASLDNLAHAKDAYAAFHAEYPELAPNVSMIDAADLAERIAAGTAVDVWLEGAWAGLFAVQPAPLLGAPGWLIIEEILAPQFRGRRLGAALQRAGLAATVPAGAEGMIWGTIHVGNLPSRRTAARVGRQEVDLRWLVPMS